MIYKISPLSNPRFKQAAFAILLSLPFSLIGQTWEKIDTFPNGQAEASWTAVGQPTIDTSDGLLSIKPTPDTNATSSYRVALPRTYSSGKFTIAFDFYLPVGEEQNQVGFGVGSASQGELASWDVVGTRNRFQLVSTQVDPVDQSTLPQPQNAAKVPEWTSDIFGTTEQGIFYNIWLVYDLDANPQTVTAYTKKALDPMEQEFLLVSTFEYNDSGLDDWSAIEYFAIGQGLQDHPPAESDPTDALGALFDNIYLSDGENVTLSPDSYQGAWEKIDTFENGSTDAEWDLDEGVTAAVSDGSVLIQTSVSNAGAVVPLASSLSHGSLTLSMDVYFPSGGLNNSMFAVVGENELAATGAARYGNNDRLLTFGTTSPQALTKWTQWTADLLGDTQQDKWYHLWLVYDIDALSLEVYSADVPESGEIQIPTEAMASYDLGTSYETFSHLIVGGWQANNVGIRIDNIYQTLGTNLSIPSEGEDPFVQGWTFTDLGWVYMYTPDWGHSIFMGFVYMADAPWLYSLKLGWTLLHTTVQYEPSGLGFYMYNDTEGWIYTQDDFGGWYWLVGTNPQEWKNFFTNP